MEIKLIDNYTEQFFAHDEETFVFSYDDNYLDNEHIEILIIKFINDIKKECKNHFEKYYKFLDINAPKLIFNFNFENFENFEDSYKEDYYDWFYFFYDFDENELVMWFEHIKNQSKLIIQHV
jgi:hypothetical protein